MCPRSTDMFVKVFLFVFLFCLTDASTHWVVTEDGRIQENLESPFAMKRPDDLVSFIHQERTHEFLKQTKEKLLEEQAEIDKNEDKEIDLEERHYKTDRDCLEADKKLQDFDFFITSVLPLEHKDIEITDHIDLVTVSSSDVQEPNCTSSYNLPYSVHAYDHMEGVQNRNRFPFYPVSGLKSSLNFLSNPDEAATAISKSLQTNSTSWVLYNLAAFYWRMKGNMSEAVECLRRALHFSPEYYKDVALVTMANILHRAHFTFNATVLMHHALKISDDYSINHFTLANLYASMGMYNHSIKYFLETLKRQEDFESAKKCLAAVRCHVKLNEKFKNQQLSLERTVQELEKYRIKHEKYLQDYKQFSSLHLPVNVLIERDTEFHRHIIKIKRYYSNSRFHIWANDSGVYFLPLAEIPSNFWYDDELNVFYDISPPLKMTAKQKDQHLHEIRSKSRKSKKAKKKTESSTTSISENVEKKEGVEKKSSIEEYNSLNKDIYDWTDKAWPSSESCVKYANYRPAWDEFPSAYVDPETRGFKVRYLITTNLGLENEEMHNRPWHPPDCANLESIETTPYDNFIVLDPVIFVIKQDTYLQNRLLTHVNNGYVWPEDLGQRILTALRRALRDKNAEHIWVLYNLAGLYWRVNGDNLKAIECLRRSVYHAPSQHLDIPLISLSNIMYRVGKINDAFNLLIFALKINDSEPATYLSMGNTLQAQNNLTGSIQFYSYAALLKPDYTEAFEGLLIVKCLEKLGKNTDTPQETIEKWKVAVASQNEFDNIQDISTQEVNDDVNKVFPIEDKNIDPVSFLNKNKDGVDSLLDRTDDLIHELRYSSAENLENKLNEAKKLLGKLEKMRSSLGMALDETIAVLENKEDADLNITCSEAIVQTDFTFRSNYSYLSSLEHDIDVDATECDGAFPTCDLQFPHLLEDVISMDSLTEGPKEKELAEFLKKLVKATDLSTSLRCAMLSFPTSYKVFFLTSFFWRISGNSKQALSCLFAALNLASANNTDLVLYAISDYLAAIGLYDEAIAVAWNTKESVHKAFLIGNILSAKRDYAQALYYYQSTLKLNKNFADSYLRHKAASCLASA